MGSKTVLVVDVSSAQNRGSVDCFRFYHVLSNFRILFSSTSIDIWWYLMIFDILKDRDVHRAMVKRWCDMWSCCRIREFGIVRSDKGPWGAIPSKIFYISWGWYPERSGSGTCNTQNQCKWRGAHYRSWTSNIPQESCRFPTLCASPRRQSWASICWMVCWHVPLQDIDTERKPVVYKEPHRQSLVKVFDPILEQNELTPCWAIADLEER